MTESVDVLAGIVEMLTGFSVSSMDREIFFNLNF